MEYEPLLSSNQVSTEMKSKFCKVIITISSLLLCMLAIILLYHHTEFLTNQSIINDIRNGDNAEGIDYPWIASWRTTDNTHCCTGSLIHQNPPIILTAAHCTACGMLGGVDLGRTLSRGYDSTSDSFSIDEIIVHPEYKFPEIDVALVILKGKTSRDTIQLVQPELYTRDMFAPGTPMEILGYGAINQNDTILAASLQYGVIKYWKKNDCQKQLKTQCKIEAWYEKQMLCGWDYYESTEGGDSGGPALVNGYLSGVNSFSPTQCKDNRIIDIFTDVGSIRHWIEDIKPTIETYIIGIHVCDEIIAETNSNVEIMLHGTNGNSNWLMLSQSNNNLERNQFNVFQFEIDNIGWDINSITFQLQNIRNEDFCFDFVIGGRLDSPQLFKGFANTLWIRSKAVNVPINEFCKLNPELHINYDNNIIETDGKKKNSKTTGRKSIGEYYYTLIIHICEETFADSSGQFYVRLHGTYDSTEWFKLENNKQSFNIGEVYIYNIDAKKFIGDGIENIEFEAIDNDSLCINMITVGRSYEPYYWKGSNEQFWLNVPCKSNLNTCYSFHTVPLNCYY